MAKRKLSVAEKYIDDVIMRRTVVSAHVRKQIERHVRDLRDGHKRGLVFDPEAAQHIIDFFAKFLTHTEGELDKQPFILSPWQQALFWILYGWKRKETGFRRFKVAFCEIGRGNGKSMLASGVGLYELIAFGEPGAQVYSAATDKKTAKLVWDTAALMVQNCPALDSRITIYRDNMHIPGTAAKFEPCASEDTNLLGLRPSCVLLDELHVHPNANVWNVFYSAMGKKKNALLIAITNSGFDKNSVCWKKRDYVVRVLDQKIDDDSWFGWISGIDDEDDWEDETCWMKANPGLGINITMDEMRSQALQARNDPSALTGFLRYRLSRWTESHTVWMPMHLWDKCDEKVAETDLEGRFCIGAMDLSTTTDVSAFVLLFPPTDDDPRWRIVPRFFLPRDSMEERVKRDKVDYDVWERQGLFVMTQGKVIDYRVIHAEIRDLAERFDFTEIVYDRWNSSDIVRNLEEDGMILVKWGQGMRDMNAPMKRLMELVLTSQLAHGGNPILRWMAKNVAAFVDPSGFIKPDKARSIEKIDGVVALIMALGRGMVVSTDVGPTDAASYMMFA